MTRKKHAAVPVIVLILLIAALFAPIPAAAVDGNVIDWLDNEQPAGQEQQESVEISAVGEKSLAVIIGQLIFYTLLIVVMIYGLIKFLARRQKNLQPNQAVRLMGGTPLGNNKSLQLVKIGSQIYVIGVGDQVTLIKEISNEEEVRDIEDDLENQPAPFTDSMTNFLKDKWTNRNEKDPGSGFQDLFSQSLSKQKLKQEQLEQDLHKPSDEKEGRLR